MTTTPDVSAPPEDPLEFARSLAACCWCTPETQHIVMDAALAEAFARSLSPWVEDARREARNAAYYRGLLVEAAKHLRPEAFTSDDGVLHDEPLAAKVPEAVEKRVALLRELHSVLAEHQALTRPIFRTQWALAKVATHLSPAAANPGPPLTPETIREAEAHMPFELRHKPLERQAWMANHLNAAIANPGALCPCCNVTNLGEVMDHPPAPA